MSQQTVTKPDPVGIRGSSVRRGDRIFFNLSRAAGVLMLAITGAIGIFLAWKAIPSLQTDSANFFTEQSWFPDSVPPVFGIAALAFCTVVTALVAMVLAVPVAIGIALFISHYASRRVASTLGFLVDLLAAVPSIIFGLWGLSPSCRTCRGFIAWIVQYFGWIPLFANPEQVYTKKHPDCWCRPSRS